MAEKGEMNVGLDIGANSIKAVAIAPTKTGFTLLAAKESPLQSDSTENGFIADYGELVHGIKGIMEGGAFPSKTMAVALKGPSTFVRKLSIHSGSPAELQETFHWIIDQYVCLDPEEMSIDFEILGEGERYHHLNVIVVGAKKDTITDFVSVLESSKVIPRIIEPEALSLTRLFRAVSPVRADTCMLLHVGSVGSLVVFVNGGNFDWYCEIDTGGKACTGMVMEDFGLSREEAENAKKNPDLHSDPEAVRTVLLNKFCAGFADKVEKALKLYTFKGGSAPYKIMLSGGACETFGIMDSLSGKFSVPVEYLDPWQAVEVSQELKKTVEASGRYTYNIAVGLAMNGKVY